MHFLNYEMYYFSVRILAKVYLLHALKTQVGAACIFLNRVRLSFQRYDFPFQFADAFFLFFFNCSVISSNCAVKWSSLSANTCGKRATLNFFRTLSSLNASIILRTIVSASIYSSSLCSVAKLLPACVFFPV